MKKILIVIPFLFLAACGSDSGGSAAPAEQTPVGDGTVVDTSGSVLFGILTQQTLNAPGELYGLWESDRAFSENGMSRVLRLQFNEGQLDAEVQCIYDDGLVSYAHAAVPGTLDKNGLYTTGYKATGLSDNGRYPECFVDINQFAIPQSQITSGTFDSKTYEGEAFIYQKIAD